MSTADHSNRRSSDLLIDSQSPSAVDLKLDLRDSPQSNDWFFESPVIPLALPKQRPRNVEQPVDSSPDGHSVKSTCVPLGPQPDSPACDPKITSNSSGGRLETATSTPSSRTLDGYGTPAHRSSVHGPSAWDLEGLLSCDRPEQPTDGVVSPLGHLISPSGMEPPSMRSNFAYADVDSTHILHTTVPRIDFASADAASRTQDIIEILDAVLLLARTHNGSGLKAIADYTSAFRVSTSQSYGYL